MQPERTVRHDISLASIEWLSETLFDLANDQEVRVIEALAAVFSRRWREDFTGPVGGLCEATTMQGFGTPTSDPDTAARREICRRIARRALRGSLVDPTRGATAVHRIDVSPSWSRDLLPIGIFGPFLFYRLIPWQLRTSDRLGAKGPDQQEIAGFDWQRHLGGHMRFGSMSSST